LTALTAALVIGCAGKEEAIQSVRISPGPPKHWDVGDWTLKRPLSEDMDDGFLEFSRSPDFSFGLWLAHNRLSARSHARSDMLVYLHSGIARFNVGEMGFTVSTGDALYIPRGAIYTAVSMSDRPLQLFTIYSPPFDLDDIEYHERAESEREGTAAVEG